MTIVRENVCNKAKKQKSLLDFEKKNVKKRENVEVMTCEVLEITQSVFFPVSVCNKLLRRKQIPHNLNIPV